jgi:hypothetical protein
MFKYSSSACPENAHPELTMFFGPMAVVEMWLPVMSAAVDWNAKIIEIVTDAQRHWLDFANRRLAANMALPQDLGTCRSLGNVSIVYADFFQKAITDYQMQFSEIVKPDDQADSATETDLRYANTSAGWTT